MPYPSARTTFDIYKSGETTREIKMLVDMVLLVRGFRSKLDEELRKIDQSAARMETLSAILNMPGDKSQSDVARRLRIEGATVTRMVDILSKEGLVKRLPNPNDRRVNLLAITPAGEAAVKEIFTVYDKVRQHLLADMPVEDIITFHSTITTMLDRLDRPFDETISIQDMPVIDRLRDLAPKADPAK